eukprot:gnl/TRDRNA2_/TRDRNA2_176918_c0_seq1.p1 gnl/TRDRNA2_/TRDRNA2_176918_c0~~gnl/TRDRNA2_/TRDRNA2_176918_c0_seq1.p1  ORF type:complete len:518 (+),score=121.24 gnl/TRDRNA2_/TRDRNA2_176918_c0_seq1:117-1670(+)
MASKMSGAADKKPVQTDAPEQKKKLLSEADASTDVPASSVASVKESSEPKVFPSLTKWGPILMVFFVEGADKGICHGGIVMGLQDELGIGPMQFGILTLFSGVACAVCAPFWGWITDKQIFTGKQVLMICLFGWAFGTIAFAMTNFFWQMLIVRFATDFFVSAIKPFCQTWILSNVPTADHGKAMSQLNLFGLVGWTILAGVAATLSNVSVGFLSGWRALLVIWATFAILPNVILAWATVELTPKKKNGPEPTVKDGLLLAVRFPSIAIMCIVSGLMIMPLPSMQFEALWQRYLGYSPVAIGLAKMAWCPAMIVGPILGGYISDYGESRSKKYGRLTVAFISTLLGMPLAVVLFVVLPDAVGGDSLVPYTVVKCLWFIVATWGMTAVIVPLLGKVTAADMRSKVLSMNYSCEMLAIAFLGQVLSGFIAEKFFGYSSLLDPEIATPTQMQTNSLAIRNSLLIMNMASSLSILALIALLFFTFPRDLKRFQAKERQEAEESDDDTDVPFFNNQGKQTEA